jgi:hypothetical protein
MSFLPDSTNNTTTTTTTSPWSTLRPIVDPDEKKAFWDAILSFSPSLPSSPDSSSTMSFPDSSSTMSFPDSTVPMSFPDSTVPMSFPPDRTSFVKYYADREPLILLPNNFLVTSHSLEEVHIKIEGFLQSYPDLAFSASGSTWSGSILDTYNHTTFRICVYKSRRYNDAYIIEVQRCDGDGFMFGSLYQKLKEIFNTTTLHTIPTPQPNNNINNNNNDDDDDDDDDNDNYNSSKLSKRSYASHTSDMLTSSPDLGEYSYAISRAIELCYDKDSDLLYEFNIICHLVGMINNNDIDFYDWNKQRVLLALTHLCTTNNNTNKLKHFLRCNGIYHQFIEILTNITVLPPTYHTYQHAIKHATTLLGRLR